MKSIKSLILAMSLVLGSSCSLDHLEDPNNVKLEGAQTTLLLNGAQTSATALFQTGSLFGMQMTRMANSGGVQYENVFQPQSFDGAWTTAYYGVLQQTKQVIEYADANGWARHGAMAKVLSAYTLVQLVDLFGDVPYSDALKGFQNLNPKTDNGADIYDAALGLLDQAVLDFKTNSTTAVPAGYLNPLAQTPQDFFYGNNYANWLRMVNSLRLRIYLNLKLVDPARATTGINTVLADADGLIVTQVQNFVFQYGTSNGDPESRHPLFLNNYPGGGGNYMSNFMMWSMYHSYDATNRVGTTTKSNLKGDPRMRFYFYRQTNINNTNPNNIRCVTATSIPAHYPARVGSSVIYGVAGIPPGISTNSNNAAWSSAVGTLSRTFCYPTDVGYWGRDHVDNQGIPPDGLLRSAWGVYPAGGRFDGSSNQSVNATTRGGMGGAGIQPMMMRSYVQFMLAEAALTMTLTGASSPDVYYQNGINFSFTDVRDLAVNGGYGAVKASTEASVGANGSTALNVFYTPADYSTDVTTYVTAAMNAYNAAPATNDKLNFIARESWVSLFGCGLEAYNLYRRTGMPTGMQPTIQSNPGTFPRTFWYPNSFASLNNTVSQKSNLGVRVFWDTNTSNLDF